MLFPNISSVNEFLVSAFLLLVLFEANIGKCGASKAGATGSDSKTENHRRGGSTALSEAGAACEIRVRGGPAGLVQTKVACHVMRKKVIPFPHFIARAQDLVEKIVR